MPPALRALSLTLFALSVLLLGWTTPLHIDEWVYPFLAERITAHPLDPYGGEAVSFGRVVPVFEGVPHPPGFPILLALLGGDAPAYPAHARWILLPFLLLFLASLRPLARFFRIDAGWGSSFLLFSPAFFLSAQRLMTDFPSLSLFHGALLLLLLPSPRPCWGAVLLGGAIFMRYTFLLLLPLFLLVARRRCAVRGRAALLLMLLSLLPVLLWNGFSWVRYGETHFGLHLRILAAGGEGIVWRLGALPTFLGGVLVPGAFLLGNGRKRLVVAFIVGLLLFAGVAPRLDPPLGRKGVLLAALLCTNAVTFVEAAVAEIQSVRQGKGGEGALLLAWGGLGLAAALVSFVSARALLPALYPLTALLLRRFEEKGGGRRGLGLALLVSAGVSLLLGFSDRSLAEAHADFPRRLAAAPPGTPIWFTGEWGFRVAMTKAGFSPLVDAPGTPLPQTGDRIVVAEGAAPAPIPSPLQGHLRFLRTEVVPSKFPLLLMNERAHAGFYSAGWGCLPFAPAGGEALERFTWYRVEGRNTTP
ncbi:MAG: hypothetical protein D6795_17535 [Deltaproteobacteria bacterium]|nr:MAG: hypothetical protein D6795_17535 [Deltaproteobacteria bacterium]